MGLFSSFTDGAKTASASVSASDLLSPAGSFSMTGVAQDALMGGSEDVMRNLLGMDPKVECPAGTNSGGDGMNGDNDPCGQNDDPLKGALLGLGMALAGPTIMDAGAMLGGAMDSGLGAVTAGIGGAIAGTAAGLGGMVGLDPDGPGQALMNGAIGAGAAVGLGGGNLTDAGVGALGAMTTTATAVTPSAISSSTVLTVNDATSIDSDSLGTTVLDSVSSGIQTAGSATTSFFSSVGSFVSDNATVSVSSTSTSGSNTTTTTASSDGTSSIISESSFEV